MLGGISIDRADQLFSLWVRARAGWRCEKCSKTFRQDDRRGLENSHYWSRRHENTRFDPDNCAALCTSCHMRFTGNPHEHHEWFKERLGEARYKALTIRANSICPIKRKQHRKEQAKHWKDALKEMGIKP